MSEDTWQQRFQRLTNLFFGEQFEAFPVALFRCYGVVTGSVAREMFLGRGPENPRDFNIIVPHGVFVEIDNWLTRLGYEEDEERAVHPHFGAHVFRFRAYQGGDRKVTVTESKGPDVMDVIALSPTTAEMILMTSGGLIALYPDHLTSGHCLLGASGEKDLKEGRRFGSVNGTWAKLYENTGYMTVPCGGTCPSIWRHTGTDRNILKFEWDTRYTILRIVQSARTEWRLPIKCRNSFCDYSICSFNIQRALWRQASPSTNLQTSERELDISQHDPPFASGFKGLLFATRCDKPLIVNVPTTEGRLECRSMDDLKVDCWVKQRKTDSCYTQRALLRRTYKSIPGLQSLWIDNAYTIFVEEPETNPAHNPHVNALAHPKATSCPILGNILVLKQDNINMELKDVICDDIDIVKAILRSAMQTETLPRNTPRG
ncbi:hypothetical protein BJ138DRAFT_1118468 [Hygrophoropsis aurantiaca]|uniref:Uncharacterized protein n=1 Tax=Hygrophoropsis aurantiaca TaxID=72124 RepID=A0ACB7ZXC9_9AGAM|nr:hypothetical protein BJ138DRAFT_1118468 [Hygrophoropsis aurantiaca]